MQPDVKNHYIKFNKRHKRLLEQMEQFLSDCRRMGFNHQNLLTFFTLMPLAVSPELKCTDRGLVDALHKRLLPLIDEIKEISSDGT